jgi:hypothetical protein
MMTLTIPNILRAINSVEPVQTKNIEEFLINCQMGKYMSGTFFFYVGLMLSEILLSISTFKRVFKDLTNY